MGKDSDKQKFIGGEIKRYEKAMRELFRGNVEPIATAFEDHDKNFFVNFFLLDDHVDFANMLRGEATRSGLTFKIIKSPTIKSIDESPGYQEKKWMRKIQISEDLISAGVERKGESLAAYTEISKKYDLTIRRLQSIFSEYKKHMLAVDEEIDDLRSEFERMASDDQMDVVNAMIETKRFLLMLSRKGG